MTTRKAIPASARRAESPSISFAMPSSVPPADRGQGRGGLVEDGVHQRDLVASGERQAALQQFE